MELGGSFVFRRSLFAITLFFSLLIFSICSPVFAAPHRIISLSPVGTEILYMLGQEDDIIGVTSFCDYPPEVKQIPKIGGFTDVSLENLVSMKPDLIVIQDIHKDLALDLSKLGMTYVMAKQGSIDDIYQSIAAVGAACGVDDFAERRVNDIKLLVSAIAEKSASLPKRRVLICASRELSEPRISVFWGAGGKSFYDELISLAGGENVLKNDVAAYPKISAEGFMSLNPEVIIDLVGDSAYYHSSGNIDKDAVFAEERLREQWLTGPQVSAVKQNRIYLMRGTMYLRPGPRIPEILKAFAAAIHPEVQW